MGIFSLSFQNLTRLKNYKGIIYSLATGVFIMSYSLVDGYGARINGSFLSYMAYLFPIEGLLFLILLNLINKREIIKKIIKNSKFSFFVGGTISSLVYILIVWAFTKAPIPLITTLRETSIIFALIIGAIFLMLKNNKKRSDSMNSTYEKNKEILKNYFNGWEEENLEIIKK